ncbi:alpha/beta fold hydrolase [Roseovarius sp. M141]|uniref:alpha/beta fold hydrolase n=1 Tax=Roseovarius sp. M141 TaxID=2583806 RepID=UPI0033800780|nr:alpha/beta fold hydrolase [Roseovarius sp. M141]
MLIHGLGLNRACWQWTQPALTDRYRVLAYDLYGHGQSPVPPGPPSLALFSAQIQGVMDHAGLRSGALVGFSLGGMIARHAAQTMPGRIAALGILNSPHRRAPDAQAAILQRVAQARTNGPAATVEDALERWFTDSFRADHPAVMDLVRGWVMANDISVYHTIYSVFATGIDDIVQPDPPIACPAFVLTGDEDFGNGPQMARAIASEIDGAELHILQNLRHMALAEDPGAVNIPLRRFLDRVTQPNPGDQT